MIKKKFIYTFFIIFTLGLIIIAPAYSDDIDDLQKQIQETQNDIEEKNSELQKISTEINKIMSSNISIYAKISEIESRKKDSQKLIEQEKKDLEIIQNWIDQKEDLIKQKKEKMNDSVILIYKMSNLTILDQIFSVNDLKWTGYESFLYKSRLREIERLADLKNDLERNADLIADSEELLKKQQALYDESLIKLYDQRAQIQQELIARQQMQQSLNKEIMSLNTSLSNLSTQLQQAILTKAQQASQGQNAMTGGGDSNGGNGTQTPSASDKYSIYLDGNLIVEHLEGPIRVAPANGDKSSLLQLNGNSLFYNVLEFRTTSNVFIINELPIQLYLYGLGEVPSSWHMEVLKAQAIAGRTYAIKNWNKRTYYGYNLRDDTYDQNYVGAQKVFASYGDRWKQAVDATNNKVIMSGGKLINAYYHSTDGGHTLASEEVWSSALPYTRAESDWYQSGGVWKSYDSASPWSYKKWGNGTIDDGVMVDLINASIYLSKDPNSMIRQNNILPSSGFDIVSALNGQDFNSVYGELINVQSIYNNDSTIIDGSVRKTKLVRVTGSKGTLDIDAGIFYTVFNSRSPGTLTLFYSNLWTSVKENGYWNFYSRGYPHRVGMCQYGAEGRAEAGQTYDQILKAYYRGTTLGNYSVGDIRIGLTKVATSYALITPYTHTTYKVFNNGAHILNLPYGSTLKIVRNNK